MKILVDMNFAFRWAAMLEAEGFEALHWISVGAPNAPDKEILHYAQASDFTILTNDLDFGALLAISRAVKPSVIQVRVRDAQPENLVKMIASCLKTWSKEIESGAVISIDINKSRVHVLPLSGKPEN